LYAAQFSAEAGLRIGELAALDWRNVDLTAGSVYVEHGWNPIDGLLTPKDSEPRRIYLTKEARDVLERWVAVVGVQQDGPVFPNPGGGRLSIRWLQRAFARAMKDGVVMDTGKTKRGGTPAADDPPLSLIV
jgi:integrase